MRPVLIAGGDSTRFWFEEEKPKKRLHNHRVPLGLIYERDAFVDWLEFLGRQVRAERPLARELRPLIVGAAQETAQRVRDAAGDPIVALPAPEDLLPAFEEVGERRFPDILRAGWERAARQIRAAVRSWSRQGLIDFSLEIPGIAEWLRLRPRRYGRQVSDTLIDLFRFIIERGLEEGMPVPDIANRIVDETEEVSEAAALRIARTESTAAINRGTVEHYRASEVITHKDWLDSGDGKVRPTHVGVARVRLDEPFRVGASLLDHPGDPSGPPEETVNCRCAVAPVVED